MFLRVLMAAGLFWTAFAAGLPAGAQGPQERSWEELRREVSPNQSLRLELKAGGLRLGRAVAVEDSALVMRVHSEGPSTRFARGQIRSVRVKTRSRWKLGALIGAGVGAASTSMVALTSGISIESRNDAAPIVIPLFGAVGAGIGAAVGSQIAEYREYSPDGNL